MCWNIFFRFRLSSLSFLRRRTKTQNPSPSSSSPSPTRVSEEKNVELQQRSLMAEPTHKEQQQLIAVAPVSPVPDHHQQQQQQQQQQKVEEEEEEELGLNLNCSVEESVSSLVVTPLALSLLSDPSTEEDESDPELPDLEPESDLEIDELLLLDDVDDDDLDCDLLLDNLGLDDEDEEEEIVMEDDDDDNAVEEYLYGGMENLEYEYEEEIEVVEEKTQVEENLGFADGEKIEVQVVEKVEAVEEELEKLGLEEDDDDDDGKMEVLEEERKKKKIVEVKGGERSTGGGRRFNQFPLRPDQPDCLYYLRYKTCRYGINCKYNHPLRTRKQQQQVRSLSSSKSPELEQEQPSSSRLPVSNEVVREKEKGLERDQEQAGHMECKYYFRPGGCKFGKSCRYQHPQEKTYVGPSREFNFLGLPIRPGEKECMFYMRTGSCKYANYCRFNHPDPTDLVVMDPRHHNNRSLPIQSSGLSQPAIPSWTSPRGSNEVSPFLDSSAPYGPVVPPQGMYPNLEWNGYMGPVNPPMYTPMMNMGPLMSPLPSAGPITKTPDGFTPYQQQMPGEAFPERPGQTECTYFMKNGDCKFKFNCKFHHPKDRAPKCALNSMGLPLRPDQIICSYYSRYGICKFGPACKYDHPPNCGSSASIMSAPDLEGSRNGSESLMPQSV